MIRRFLDGFPDDVLQRPKIRRKTGPRPRIWKFVNKQSFQFCIAVSNVFLYIDKCHRRIKEKQMAEIVKGFKVNIQLNETLQSTLPPIATYEQNKTLYFFKRNLSCSVGRFFQLFSLFLTYNKHKYFLSFLAI